MQLPVFVPRATALESGRALDVWFARATSATGVNCFLVLQEHKLWAARPELPAAYVTAAARQGTLSLAAARDAAAAVHEPAERFSSAIRFTSYTGMRHLEPFAEELAEFAEVRWAGEGSLGP